MASRGDIPLKVPSIPLHALQQCSPCRYWVSQMTGSLSLGVRLGQGPLPLAQWLSERGTPP